MLNVDVKKRSEIDLAADMDKIATDSPWCRGTSDLGRLGTAMDGSCHARVGVRESINFS